MKDALTEQRVHFEDVEPGTAEILSELGYSEAEQRMLCERRVICRD